MGVSIALGAGIGSAVGVALGNLSIATSRAINILLLLFFKQIGRPQFFVNNR